MNDQRIRELLEQNLELNQQNNELLHKIYRSIVWRRIIRIVYWVVIIGVAIGAFYFLQPYVEVLFETYEQFRNGIQQNSAVDGAERFRSLLGDSTSTPSN